MKRESVMGSRVSEAFQTLMRLGTSSLLKSLMLNFALIALFLLLGSVDKCLVLLMLMMVVSSLLKYK